MCKLFNKHVHVNVGGVEHSAGVEVHYSIVRNETSYYSIVSCAYTTVTHTYHL